MAATSVTDVSNQVQEFWSPVFMDELMETTILASLVNKDYDGEIKQKGDTVHVSQINRATATRKTVGSGHETFSTGKLSTSRISIVADQVISAGYEFDSLVEIQSQIGDQNSKIRQGLLEAYEIELNNYLYSLVAPSAATPDHILNGVADFNAGQVATVRKLASQAKWRRDGWWLLLDPQYYTDFLNATTMTSQDHVDDRPLVGGQFVTQRLGFNVLEDNSEGMGQLSPAGAAEDFGLAFHRDWLHLVHQIEPEFEVSSTHSNKQFGYIITVKAVVGAKLGIDGDKKHIQIYAT